MMLSAPIDGDLPQRFGTEFKPSRLDLVPPKGVLEERNAPAPSMAFSRSLRTLLDATEFENSSVIAHS
jgi:hypothetical protein